MPILSFNSNPEFRPHYTPKEMLSMGVFGGTYFNKSQYRWGLPLLLFISIDRNNYDSPIYSSLRNHFQVDAPMRTKVLGMPMSIRRLSPLGWYQWYVKFYFTNIGYYGVRQTFKWEDYYRIQQWRSELRILYQAYINACAGVCDLDAEPSEVDTDQIKVLRQQLLEFAWDYRINALLHIWA